MAKHQAESEPWLGEIAAPLLRSIWSPEEHAQLAQSLRKEIVTGRAALYLDAALTLAESAPARARTLARQAVEAVEALHKAGDAPVELLDAYRERLAGLLGG